MLLFVIAFKCSVLTIIKHLVKDYHLTNSYSQPLLFNAFISLYPHRGIWLRTQYPKGKRTGHSYGLKFYKDSVNKIGFELCLLTAIAFMQKFLSMANCQSVTYRKCYSKWQEISWINTIGI